MFDVFMEEKVISVLMLACMVLSIFLRVFLGLLYLNMIKETDNMASTNNKMLKQCKLKFANCYQLSNGVANIPVFVDKFLNRLSFGRISFSMMYHLSGQAMLLSVVFSGVGICRRIMSGSTLGDILPFYIVSFLGLYLYFSISTVMDIKGRKRVLKINLVDYLENHLSPRIDVTRQDIEMLYGEDIFNSAESVARPLNSPGNTRKKRIVENSSRNKRTVEVMPMGSRLTAEEKTSTGNRQTAEEKMPMGSRQTLGGKMPMGSRLTPEEKKDLFAVADSYAHMTEEPDDWQNIPPVGEEELEALLKEFLAT